MIAMMVCPENLINAREAECCECRLERSPTRIDEEGAIIITEDTSIDMPVMDIYMFAELKKVGFH